MALLSTINSFIFIWIKNLPLKKWLKFYNGSSPKGVAGLIVLALVDQDIGEPVGFGGDSAVHNTSLLP